MLGVNEEICPDSLVMLSDQIRSDVSDLNRHLIEWTKVERILPPESRDLYLSCRDQASSMYVSAIKLQGLLLRAKDAHESAPPPPGTEDKQ